MGKKSKNKKLDKAVDMVNSATKENQEQLNYEAARKELIEFNEKMKEKYGLELRTYINPVIDLVRSSNIA